MVCKSKADSKKFGIQTIDLTQLINDLIDWRRECSKCKDEWEDPVRVAMIDSFEDMLFNAVVEV